METKEVQMETWLSTIGEWHKKFSEWAFDMNIKGWRSMLRIALFTIVDAMLWCICIWGVLVLLLVVFGKFIAKNHNENTEED